MMEIDFETLRNYLIDYFGTASMYNHVAIVELSEVESASPKELIEIAIRNNIDLDDFTYGVSR